MNTIPNGLPEPTEEQRADAVRVMDVNEAAVRALGCDCEVNLTVKFCDHWPDHPARCVVTHQTACKLMQAMS